MITIDEAFRKFKHRLELTDKEQENATARHQEVRTFLATKFKIKNDFLTGSYKRHTKTKPLKDIDIMFELDAAERHFRNEPASKVINAFYDALVEKYGKDCVRKQSHSVNVEFGVKADADDQTDERVLSIDAVPAFAAGDDYEIPDTLSGKWIKTNPKIHAQKATDAHQAYSCEWKGLVRMAKYWNNNPKHGEKPVKPNFLIEVMAMQCLHGDFHGCFDYEFQAFFSTLADRIFDEWPDPAGLGPPISNDMDFARKQRARDLLQAAAREAGQAIHLARQGRNGEALAAWRKLFGPLFPLS